MSVSIEHGYVDFPNVANVSPYNWVAYAGTWSPVDASASLSIDLEQASTDGFRHISFTHTGLPHFFLDMPAAGGNYIGYFWGTVAGTWQAVTATLAQRQAAGVPDTGRWMFRFEWDAAIDTFYMKGKPPGDANSDAGWTTINSVVFAGESLVNGSRNWAVGPASGGHYGGYKVYRAIVKETGQAPFLDFDFRNLTADPGTSMVLPTGQTATITRIAATPLTFTPLEVVETPPAPLEPAVFSVDLCRNWERIGQLQTTAYEFRGVNRDTEPGEWVMTFPAGAPVWSGYTDAEGNAATYRPTDVDTVRLVEDGVTRYEGFVAETSAGSGGIERLIDETGVRWQLSGPDLWYVLNGRYTFPTPTTEAPWAGATDVRTGRASTVLAAYLNVNAGATAIAARAIPGFSAVDTGAGVSRTWSARLTTLTELAQRICGDAELTLRFTVDATGAIIITVRAPSNYAESKLLSDLSDLTSIHARYVPPRSTHVIAGGSGTGTGRIFADASDGSTGASRTERFVDVASLTQSSEVGALAEATLRADGNTWSISAMVTERAARVLGFGRSVFPGDKVTIQVDGERFIVPVSSVAWEITAERQRVIPTLGSAVPDEFTGALRAIDSLSTRLDRTVA